MRKVVYGKANPKKSYLLGYLLRLTVMIAIFAMLYLCDIGDLLAALVGMFIMKLSAYLQPAAFENIVQNTKKRRKRMWGAWV